MVFSRFDGSFIERSTQLIKRYVNYSKKLQSAIQFEFRNKYLGQRWPMKPKTLNLLVNDICNSKCQMCLIWKRKLDIELTPEEIREILSDSLFDDLRNIGVSGGEPTLRKDLPDIFRVLVEKKPRIKSTGIITNAIQSEMVISQVTACAEICHTAGVRFSAMVSLDGIGKTHDRIRGRNGNFDSAMQVFNHFRDNSDIPIFFGCTITKENLWEVDAMLDFARDKKVYIRFRIAEFINRLYNNEQTYYIRNFTQDELFHLVLFFAKLEYQYETNDRYKRTYRNIREMLLGNGRQISCPYQTQAIVLDSRGQLLYCSPKSPILGNTIEKSAEMVYLENIDTRKKIISHDCDRCIHDYHSPIEVKDLVRDYKRKKWFRQLNIRRIKIPRQLKNIEINSQDKFGFLDHAFIVGWYGTETVGDKAILGGILHQLKQQSVIKISIASYYPFLTKQTVLELGFPEIEIIDTYSADFIKTARVADMTIMGGGPLMEIGGLGGVLRAFREAKRNQKYTWIAGCGIGPLYEKKYIDVVKEILTLSDKIELRDEAAVKWAQKLTFRVDIKNVGDYAKRFVDGWLNSQSNIHNPKNYLCCYLRSWPVEYRGSLSITEYESLKMKFENQLSIWIRSLCDCLSLEPRFYAMHHFVIGGDDREYNRSFVNQYLSDLNPYIEIRPFSVQQILESIIEARLCITMRFHSTLFANTIRTPFFAIDYTQGGKVHHYLHEQGKADQIVGIQQIANGEWPDSMQ